MLENAVYLTVDNMLMVLLILEGRHDGCCLCCVLVLMLE